MEERKAWNETYMNLHLTRKLITGCANDDVAKDLDKGVRLGNTFYPDEVEDATGLILQYEKEKQREQRSNRYNNRNYNNNNNNNNNNDDDKKNDDDTKNTDNGIESEETVGAVIGIMNETSRKERFEHILALIESGQYDDASDPDMTEEEWYDDGEIVGALTDHDIREGIRKEVTMIADIQNGIEKRKQRSRDAERKKQQESKSVEAIGN